MRLITAHKILIASATAFFLFFAGFELRSYAHTSAPVDLVSGIFGVAAAVGFALYFYRLHRRDSTRA
jgi:hypothetical protein